MNLPTIPYSTDLIIQIGLGFLILLLLVKLTPFYFNKIKRNSKLKRGVKKEKDAYKVLKKMGFKIIGNNIKYNYNLLADEESIPVGLEIDYLVRKNSKTYIIEVKTGESATQITNSSTRRQILEYSLFIKNDGVFLLDMENKTLKEIVYPITYKNKPKSFPILAFTLLGSAVVLFFLFYFKIIHLDTDVVDEIDTFLIKPH